MNCLSSFLNYTAKAFACYLVSHNRQFRSSHAGNNGTCICSSKCGLRISQVWSTLIDGKELPSM